MPPAETRLPTVADLADVGLTDREGRRFGLADAAGAVTVVAFATGPCAGACPAAIEGLLDARDRLSGRPAGDEDVATGGESATASVEFVLVSDAPEALPAGATAPAIAPDAPGVGGTRWRVGRAGARELAALLDRLGVAASSDAPGAGRLDVQLFDAAGARVQRYRADPLDVARLVDEVAYLRDRGR